MHLRLAAWLLPAVVVGCGMLTTGCEKPAQRGVVLTLPGQRTITYGFVPRLPVRTPRRDQTGLYQMVGPYYVIGFVVADPNQPLAAHPRLLELADELYLDNGDVVQVALPPIRGELPVPEDLPPTTSRPNFIHLLDPERTAWAAFLGPQPGTLMLVDKDRYIRYRTEIDADTSELRAHVRRVAQEVQQYHDELRQGSVDEDDD